MVTASAQPHIDRVERNADPQWREDAYEALKIVATRQYTFNANDVWFQLESNVVSYPRERRAMGPIFLRGRREGIIRPTSSFVTSKRTIQHGQPVRVWASLIYGKK